MSSSSPKQLSPVQPREVLTKEQKLEKFETFGKVSDEEDGKIIKDENEEKIEVKPDTYKKFMKYSGGKFPMIMLNVGLISSLLAETYLTMYIGRWALDQSI